MLVIVGVMTSVLVTAAVVTFAVVTADDDTASTTTAATTSSTGERTSEPPATGPPATAEGPTTTDGTDDTAASAGLPELPPVQPSEDAPTPTTRPGTDPIEIPVDRPLFGEIRVSVVSGGYTDVPVALRERQAVTIISAADDNVATVIEVWSPSHRLVFSWVGGEPDVVNGVEFSDDDDPLLETGGYVIRVVSTGRGGDLILRFFGEE